jgi:hypothetical protein
VSNSRKNDVSLSVDLGLPAKFLGIPTADCPTSFVLLDSVAWLPWGDLGRRERWELRWL